MADAQAPVAAPELKPAEEGAAVADAPTTAGSVGAAADEAGSDAHPAPEVSLEGEASKEEASKEEASKEEAPVEEKETAEEKAEADDAKDTNAAESKPSTEQNLHNKRPGNVKTAFEEQEESSDADEIRHQVEFYFSDSNLPIDEYLLRLTGGPANKPVPLKTIHSFKRMRHFQPYSAVVEAVKQSKQLELLANDEVRRKTPLDEKFTDDVSANRPLLITKSMARSIYAKGFGEEGKKTAFEIEELFKPYGILAVRLRREDGSKTFKGSVFVEFSDEDSAKAFLALPEKPQFNGQDLQIMSKEEYVKMKTDAIANGDIRPRSPSHHSTRPRGNNKNKRGNSRGRGGRGGRGGRNDRRGGGRDRDGQRNGDDADGDNWRDRRDKFQSRGGRGGRGGRDNNDSRKRARDDDGVTQATGENDAKKSKVDDQ